MRHLEGSSVLLKLPEPIPKYLEAANAHDSDALVSCFASDAVVHDEGEDFRGLAAIRAWNEETSRKYHFTIDPTGVQQVGDRTVVTAQVAGSFDGSPVELLFRFSIADAKINALDIGLP